MTAADEREAVEASGGPEQPITLPPPRHGRAERFNKHPWWTLLVAVMTVAGAAASIWAATGGGAAQESPPGGGPTGTTPAPSTSPPAEPEPDTRDPGEEAPPRLARGDCVTDEASPVPCTAVHRYELVADPGEDCDVDAALAHLGGRPDVDVLLVGPQRLTLPGDREACVLGDPEGEVLAGPIADAFVRGAGARWRWCGDARSGRDVPCSEPHTDEYVGTPEPAPDLAACQAAAEAYLGARFARVADRLTVTVSPAPPDLQRPTCSVSARGTQVLTDTLRGIGAKALPLA